MKLQAAVTKLTAALTRVGVSAQTVGGATGIAARLGTLLSASVSRTLITAELGFFLIQLFKNENVSISSKSTALEEALLDFFKNTADTSKVAEHLASAFYKALTEDPSVTDDDVIAYFKNVQENPTIADSYTSALARGVADSGTVTDAYTPTFGKNTTENPTIADTDVLAVGKNQSDVVPVSDVSTLALTRFFQENISVTDDIDGAASLLDDQEMLFFKSLTQRAVATEVFFRLVSYLRLFSDAATTSDLFAANFSPLKADSASIAQQFSFDIARGIADTSGVAEQLAKVFNPAPLTDAYAVADTSFRTPGLGKTESALFSDTGSLRSQGYCDFTYFAEDYVGASRTF